MAKKTLEQLEADEAKLMKQLEDLRSGKKQIAADEANEAKTILQDALSAYNKLAAAAGVGALRLVSDAERATAAKPASGKRLRLDDDKVADITSKVVKAAKAHGKEGASKQDIIKYLNTNGYELGHHYNEPHLFKIITNLRGGDSPSITVTGEKGGMRYHST